MILLACSKGSSSFTSREWNMGIQCSKEEGCSGKGVKLDWTRVGGTLESSNQFCFLESWLFSKCQFKGHSGWVNTTLVQAALLGVHTVRPHRVPQHSAGLESRKSFTISWSESRGRLYLTGFAQIIQDNPTVWPWETARLNLPLSLKT